MLPPSVARAMSQSEPMVASTGAPVASSMSFGPRARRVSAIMTTPVGEIGLSAPWRNAKWQGLVTRIDAGATCAAKRRSPWSRASPPDSGSRVPASTITGSTGWARISYSYSSSALL